MKLWLKPERFGGKGAATEADLAEARKALRAAAPHDPTLKACLLVACEQHEAYARTALSAGLTPEQRSYAAGMAKGLADFVESVEGARTAP